MAALIGLWQCTMAKCNLHTRNLQEGELCWHEKHRPTWHRNLTLRIKELNSFKIGDDIKIYLKHVEMIKEQEIKHFLIWVLVKRVMVF